MKRSIFGHFSLRAHTIMIVLLVLFGSFTIAQLSDPKTQRPASFFPEGAIVYVEAQDLESLLKWWNSSDMKANWEQSANYQNFRSSRLYLKLRDRVTRWGSGGKFSFTLDNLTRAAGDQSALALYDIGELKMIGATRISFAKAQVTEIWSSRSRFVEKHHEQQKYYVEPKEGILAFAYADPYLIISTEESLLLAALRNLKTPAEALDLSAKWQQCKKQSDSDVSVYLDQESLQGNRYFKKYWIHKNVARFSSIRATWIDLKIESDSIVEHRFFLTDPGNDIPSNIREYIQPFETIRHETLFVDAPLQASFVAEHVIKMINTLPDNQKKASFPPPFSGASDRALQAESRNNLLQQIDEPILEVKSETLLQASQEEKIAKILGTAEPAGQIRMAYPVWDQQALFVRFPSSLILHFKNFDALDQQGVRTEMLQHFLLLNSTQDQGARWSTRENGIQVLESFRPVYMLFRKPWLVLSTDETYFNEVVSALPADRAIPAGNFRVVNWKDGRWKYSRMMRRLDHGVYETDVPLFFSENLASLLETLEPVVSSSIESYGNREVVRYELSK